MAEAVLHRRGTILVRRLCLATGEAMPWHRDPERVTVILGDALAIVYRDGGPSERIALAAGQVEWDEPTARVDRAVNVGEVPHEEVTVFFLERPDPVPQPRPADDAPDREQDRRASSSGGARSDVEPGHASSRSPLSSPSASAVVEAHGWHLAGKTSADLVLRSEKRNRSSRSSFEG